MTRETITVNGRTIGYLRAGSGPALLLFHGIGGNATQFRHQLDGLADAYTVVAWDAPGYGESDDPDTDWTMATFAEHAVAFIDALGIGQAHVLGQSWGGVLAAELYRRAPERFLSLILSDTFAGGSAQPEEERAASLQARLRSLETMTPAEMAEARTPAVVGPTPSPAALSAARQMMAEIRPSGYRVAATVLAAADERDVLPTVTVPTLVITGEHDKIVPRAAADALHAAISGSCLVIIPDAGHLPNMEQPERYNAVVREFVSTASG